MFDEIESFSSPKGRLYKTPFGDFPSITTILSVKKDSSLDDWKKAVGEEEAKRVSDEATNRGTIVHKLFEDYLNGKKINLLNPVLKHHFIQCEEVLDTFSVVYGNEIPLYSKSLKVAGRCDCVVEINGEVYIVDIKTSKHFKNPDQIDSYRMQCCAYAYMLQELYGIKARKYLILISNLHESECSTFFGDTKEYIKEFVELRKEWKSLNGF